MKKLVKFAAFAMAAMMAAVSFTGCSGKPRSVDEIKKSGVLNMATNAEFEPFEFKDGSEVVGIDVEISKKIAEKLGVELKITDIAFDALIPNLPSGKADIIAAGMTADPDRLENADFSDSYFVASQMIIVLKDSTIKAAADLNGKIVGVQQGTTGDKYCTNEKGENDIKVQEVKRYNKGMEAVSDLIAGRIDAVVIDNFPAQMFVSKNADKIMMLDEALTNEEYAIALAKGNTGLKDVVNEVIKEMKDSGELEQLVNQYKDALGAE